MLIKNIKLENFKRFETLDLDLTEFDCLVGPNNSGKTTLLQALALFDFCIHHCISGSNGKLEIKRRTISPEEFYVLPIASPVDLWTNRNTKVRGRLKIIKLSVTFNEGKQVKAQVELNYNRFSISIDSVDTSVEWLRQLQQTKISYLPVFSTFLPQEERKTPAIIEDALARGRVNSVIRNLLFNLKRENRHVELVEILQRLFPTLEKIEIAFDEDTDRYITITYQEQGRPKEFDVFSAGSGFQQFVYLFGFILLRQPTTVLLDEPDVHLHGALQHALLDELRLLVKKGIQVLFATHSRDLISQMNVENILSLEEDNSVKRLHIPFDVYDTLDKLGAIEQTQLPILQTYRRILVVEDKSDWELLYIFGKTILGTSIWEQLERRLAICYAKGNPYKQDMAKLRQQLQQLITPTGSPLEMFVIADRDYHPNLTDLNQSLPHEHITWHVWQRVEIENYLLSLEGLNRLINKPLGQTTLLTPIFNNLIESSRDTADDRLVKAFQDYSNSQKKGWDVSTLSRKAREYLQEYWEQEKLSLADAKDIVLPGLKRWLQTQQLGQFSDKKLAQTLLPTELVPEIHDVMHKLVRFVGISHVKTSR